MENVVAFFLLKSNAMYRGCLSQLPKLDLGARRMEKTYLKKTSFPSLTTSGEGTAGNETIFIDCSFCNPGSSL